MPFRMKPSVFKFLQCTVDEALAACLLSQGTDILIFLLFLRKFFNAGEPFWE